MPNYQPEVKTVSWLEFLNLLEKYQKDVCFCFFSVQTSSNIWVSRRDEIPPADFSSTLWTGMKTCRIERGLSPRTAASGRRADAHSCPAHGRRPAVSEMGHTGFEKMDAQHESHHVWAETRLLNREGGAIPSQRLKAHDAVGFCFCGNLLILLGDHRTAPRRCCSSFHSNLKIMKYLPDLIRLYIPPQALCSEFQ